MSTDGAIGTGVGGSPLYPGCVVALFPGGAHPACALQAPPEVSGDSPVNSCKRALPKARVPSRCLAVGLSALLVTTRCRDHGGSLWVQLLWSQTLATGHGEDRRGERK